MLDRRAMILTALAAGAATPALAADKPTPLTKVFPYLDTYWKIPAAQRGRFTPAYYFLEAGKPMPAGRVVMVEAGARTPVAIGADGKALRLPTLAQLGRATVEAPERGKGKMGVRLELQANIAPAQRLDARELELAIGEGKGAVARIAGALSFAAPKISSANFPGAGSGQAVLASGATVALPTDRGAPYYNPAKLPGARTIVLAKAPARILLGTSG